MAIFKPGPTIAEVRGSIGGTVYSRNRYGAYMRNRSKPVNPNTTRQGIIRSIIGILRNLWFAEMTQDQRDGWKLYADNVPMMNRLGEVQNFSGYNMFCRTNSVLLYAGKTQQLDAPTEFSLGEKDPDLAIVTTVTPSKVNVYFNRLLPWASETGAYMVVYQGKPVDKTINFFNGPWRKIGVIEGADGAAPASPQAISVAFPVANGQKQWVQCRIVRKDGRTSELFSAECLVTGAPLEAPDASGEYDAGTLTTTLVFPQAMNVDVMPDPSRIKYTGGACTNLPHTDAVWTNPTTLTLTVNTAASPVGTGSVEYIPNDIPLITAAGGVYAGFEVESIVGE